MFRGSSGRLPRALCAAALLGAVAIAGCGGDSEDGGQVDVAELSTASEAPKTFVERLAKLLETSSTKEECTPLKDIGSRSLVGFPCPTQQATRESMAKFKLLDIEQHGTGAVADYRSGVAKDGAAILLYIAPDNNWAVSSFGILTKPSIGTDDGKSRAGYDAVLDRYLAAVRARDCAAFAKVQYDGDLGGKDVCKAAFKNTQALAKRLKNNPSAKPVYQGGNDTYGFYALETREPKPERSTITVVKRGADPAKPYEVVGVAPTPTVEQQRSIREQFRKKLSAGSGQPETSESRKAD